MKLCLSDAAMDADAAAVLLAVPGADNTIAVEGWWEERRDRDRDRGKRYLYMLILSLFPPCLSGHFTTFECAVHGIGDIQSLRDIRNQVQGMVWCDLVWGGVMMWSFNLPLLDSFIRNDLDTCTAITTCAAVYNLVSRVCLSLSSRSLSVYPSICPSVCPSVCP